MVHWNLIAQCKVLDERVHITSTRGNFPNKGLITQLQLMNKVYEEYPLLFLKK